MRVEIETTEAHAKAAELDVDVGTAASASIEAFQLGKHLVALAGIAANANRSADVIEHDLLSGNARARSVKFVDLRVVEPGIVAEAERA